MKKPDTEYSLGKVLLSSHISKERMLWLQMVLPSRTDPADPDAESPFTFYLCGDALYSLVHPETAPIWQELGKRPGVQIIAEAEDLADMGLLTGTVESGPIKKGNRGVLFLKEGDVPVSSAGFLHLYSPYMHRHTDQFLACIDQAVSLSVPLSVILYLDGVHLCHTNQVTTEFENVEQGLDQIQHKALDTGTSLTITACQRCSQARGYLHPGTEEDKIAPCFRKEVEVSGLSKLIPFFSTAEIVFSADCMDIAGSGDEAYVLVITGTPYGTEHTFGAISFAVALAGKNIPTYVIFVEEGAYCYIPAPESRFSGTVRDIHGVIEATAIPGLLEYAVLECSLSERGIPADYEIPDFQVFGPDDTTSRIHTLITGGHHVRVLIW